MAIRNIRRQATVPGTATETAAPIYVDSDDNRLKMIPAGSGTTEVVIQEASGAGSAEVVTATNVLTASESGKTFYLNSATEFVTTLPAPVLGLNYRFIVSAAPSGADYTVVTEAAAQILAGHVLTSQDAGGSGDTETTATATTITFVGGQSVVGDMAEVWSDGTSWFASCEAAVVAGITITG